ncbi:IgA peptidase M64-domain-containing protein [Mrakia frigida]|uniref:IgA peptidase M64-domain-containing protein n=1 Tax=Mrakia frigida TaxID=29902 RepID=UPI003FCBF2BD
MGGKVFIEEKVILSEGAGERRLQDVQLSSLSVLQASHHRQQLRSSNSLLVNIYSTDPSLLFPTANNHSSHLSLPPRYPSTVCRSWSEDREEEEGTRSSELVFQEVDALRGRRGSQGLTRKGNDKEAPKGMELFPLRISGPTENRINVAFFGDGYTHSEKSKFVSDVKRLVASIIDDGTFASTAPLFNFWGVYVESNESGVGSNGVPKDTPFGLYRDSLELRALYAAHRGRARAACAAVREGYFGSKGGGCDQMALVGNFDYYGGLGGEFTITTRSELKGALVLRHEIGHSLIPVGEEYEGGYAYFGVNSSPSLASIKWDHWLSDPLSPPRAEDAVTPLQVYPWQDLSKSSFTTTFSTKGFEVYPRTMLRFSVAGMRSSKEMLVYLDGKLVEWSIPDGWLGSLDRAWIEVRDPSGLGGLEEGSHELNFVLQSRGLPPLKTKDLVRMICSVEVTEYATKNRFNDGKDFVGTFPTNSLYNTTSYRPTNEYCLMRMVGTPTFCSVCLEGLWKNQLRRISLIDNFSSSVSCIGAVTTSQFLLELIPLGHLRSSPPSDERYFISWFHNGVRVPELENFDIVDGMELGASLGRWRVEVQLWTKEVRKDEDGVLRASREWVVEKGEVPLKC